MVSLASQSFVRATVRCRSDKRAHDLRIHGESHVNAAFTYARAGGIRFNSGERRAIVHDAEIFIVFQHLPTAMDPGELTSRKVKGKPIRQGWAGVSMAQTIRLLPPGSRH